MRRIRRFLGLAPVDRRLLLTASIVLVGVRIGLSLFSFQTVVRVLRTTLRRYRKDGLHAHQPPVHRIVWAVEVASRHIPGTQTCLVKALTAQGLFDRYGYPTDLRIGVARRTDGDENRDGTGSGSGSGDERMVAHAWVECDGRVVIGDLEDLSRYTPLPPFEGGRL